MTAYLLRRLLAIVPVLILVLVIVFGLVHLLPGDPAVTLLGPGATTRQIVALRHAMGLDRPLPLQFLSYVGGLATGDLGTSLRTGRPVALAIGEKLPATIELAVVALLFALLLGIPTGVLAGRRPNGVLDSTCRLASLAGVSAPAFLTALALQSVFGAGLHWLPIAGRLSPWRLAGGGAGFVMLRALGHGQFALLWDALRHTLLPALVLASFLAATLSRFVRNAMVDVLGQDFIRTARAKGLGEFAIIRTHAMPNALVPALTVLGVLFGDMLGGAILTETVFSWPGFGRYTFEAIRNRDYPAIQSATLVFSLIFVFVTLLVDLAILRLDPRARHRATTG